MKPFLTIIILFTNLSVSHGQADNSDTNQACNPNLIFDIVEHMPTYQGGLDKLEKELNQRLKINEEINETIYVSLIVNCEGKAYNFEIVRGLKDETDGLILSELSNLQNWTSGIQNKKNIDCYIRLTLKLKKGRLKIINK